MNQEQIERLCRMLRLPAASRSEVLTKAIAKMVDEHDHYEEKSKALCLLLNCSEADLLQVVDFHKTKFNSYANILDAIAKILDIGGNGSEAMVDAVQVYKEGRQRERNELEVFRRDYQESQKVMDRITAQVDEVEFLCTGFRQALGIPHGNDIIHTLKGVELALAGRPGLLNELEITKKQLELATAERDTFHAMVEKRDGQLQEAHDALEHNRKQLTRADDARTAFMKALEYDALSWEGFAGEIQTLLRRHQLDMTAMREERDRFEASYKATFRVSCEKDQEIDKLKDEILKHQELLKTRTKERDDAQSGWGEAFGIANGKEKRIVELQSELELMTKARDGWRDCVDALDVIVKKLRDDKKVEVEIPMVERIRGDVAILVNKIAQRVGIKGHADGHITQVMAAILERLEEKAVTAGPRNEMDPIVVDATLEQAVVLLREWPMTKVVEVTGAHVPVRYIVKG